MIQCIIANKNLIADKKQIKKILDFTLQINRINIHLSKPQHSLNVEFIPYSTPYTSVLFCYI